jgi:hypothetical protein
MAFHDGGLDPDTANRLLAGRLAPDDAPPGYREVSELLHDARCGNGLLHITDDALIAAVVDAITGPDELSRKRKHVLTRIVTTKVAAATAVLAFTATGAAAATGSLPDRAQNGLARAAAHVGINLPDTANEKAREATQTDVHDSGGAVPATPTADAADDDHTRPAADSSVDDAVTSGGPDAVPSDAAPGDAAPGDAAPNHGDVVSQTAHDADPSGGKGEEVAPVARDNHGAEVTADKPAGPSNGNGNSQGEHGKPADAARGSGATNAREPHGKP